MKSYRITWMKFYSFLETISSPITIERIEFVYEFGFVDAHWGSFYEPSRILPGNCRVSLVQSNYIWIWFQSIEMCINYRLILLRKIHWMLRNCLCIMRTCTRLVDVCHSSTMKMNLDFVIIQWMNTKYPFCLAS